MVYALAARPFRWSTWLAAGVWPVTSPPAVDGSLDVGPMARASLIYLCLHGYEGDSMLYGGDGDLPCLAADMIPDLPLRPVVYLAGCWGSGLMSAAFLDRGASAVVADRNVNWSGRFLPTGSNGLGRRFVEFIGQGLGPAEALAEAKLRYRPRTDRDVALLESVEIATT